MTDRYVRVRAADLETLAMILSTANAQPLVDHQVVGRVVRVLDGLAEDRPRDQPQEPMGPQVPRRRLRLIHGSLISGLGGMGAAALAVGHRVAGQPVAAAVAAGAVAVAGTATGALYLGAGTDHIPLHASGRPAAPHTAPVEPVDDRVRPAATRSPREAAAGRVRPYVPHPAVSPRQPTPQRHTVAVVPAASGESLLPPVHADVHANQQATAGSPAPATVHATVSPSGIPTPPPPCLPVPLRFVATVTTTPVC